MMVFLTTFGSGWEVLILLMLFFGVIVPIGLFLLGLINYKKNKKRGKIILIIAALYSIVSLGYCGAF